MAKSLGIRLQPDGYAFALLDGSSKKYALSSCGSGHFDSNHLNAESCGRALAQAIKSAGGKADQISISVPSLGSVLREVSLPFSDREKVMQVLKFELESELYHLDLEDVVCDFIELHDQRATTALLATALPKNTLEQALQLAEEAGVDPHTVDVEFGALLQALASLPRGDSGAPTGVEAYLHIGSRSSLLLTLGPQGPESVRALPFGWRELDHSELIPEAPLDATADASTEEDDDSATEPSQDSEPRSFLGGITKGGDASFETLLSEVSPEVLESFRARLVAEVRRGLSVHLGQLQGFYLMGESIPGLADQIQAKCGVEAGPLALGFEDPSGNEPCPIAFGMALRGLGLGPSEMDFRQEEFRQTRGLERVEGPLTLALVGLLAFLLMDMAVHVKKARARRADCAIVLEHSVAKVNQLNETLPEGAPNNWFVRTSFDGGVVDEDKRIVQLAGRTAIAKKSFDTMVGEGDLEMPQSCLEAWRLVMLVLEEELDTYSDRWMLESLEFSAQAKTRNNEAHVLTKVGVTVFGDDIRATQKFQGILTALNRKEWAMGSAETGSLEAAKVEGARTGVIQVQVSTSKAQELDA